MEKSVKIHRVIRETNDAITLQFEDDAIFKNYTSGQFLNVFKAVGNETVSRSYSFSSSPATKELPAITIKRMPGGKLSGHLVDTLKKGDELLVSDPAGRFGLKPLLPREHLVFIGGGSGITPLFSMIKTALINSEDVRITLLYGNSDKESIIFLEQLAKLQRQFSSRLEVIHFLENSARDKHLTSVKGYIGKANLEVLLLGSLPPTGFYLCGPALMMQAITHFLQELDIDPSIIFQESFSTRSTEVIQQESAGNSRITIRRGGKDHVLKVAKDAFILQAALEGGLQLPHSCREAMCGSCKVKVLSGQVEMAENYALTDAQLHEGYTLLCSGRPVSDEIILSYL